MMGTLSMGMDAVPPAEFKSVETTEFAMGKNVMMEIKKVEMDVVIYVYYKFVEMPALTMVRIAMTATHKMAMAATLNAKENTVAMEMLKESRPVMMGIQLMAMDVLQAVRSKQIGLFAEMEFKKGKRNAMMAIM